MKSIFTSMCEIRSMRVRMTFASVSILIAVCTFSMSAFAQTSPAQAPQASAWMQIVPLAVIFFIMYFFMIRPQTNRQKKHQEFISALKRGDQVLTGSGILGRIEGITDTFVTLEIADGVRVKMLKTQIAAGAAAMTEAKA